MAVEISSDKADNEVSWPKLAWPKHFSGTCALVYTGTPAQPQSPNYESHVRNNKDSCHRKKKKKRIKQGRRKKRLGVKALR